jgi:hypothetical protein
METTESQATFKEVLQIEADLKAFEASLVQIKAAYKAFVADLGGMAGDVLGVGVFGGIKQELAAISKSVNDVLGVSLAITQEFTDKKENIEEQAETRRRQRIKESAEVEIKEAEKVIAAKRELLNAGVKPEQFVRMTPGQREALKIADEQEGVQMQRIRNEREAMDALHAQALRENDERDRREEASTHRTLANFKRMAVRLLEYYAIWTAIQTVVDTIAFVIESPFKILDDGRKYLDEIQKSADHLTGTLNANVQFSEDFVENLKLASEASKQSIMALRDVSNETGLSFNHLEDSFRALVTAGAASHVQTTRDIVGLTQILNIANEQVKGDATLRGLLADIPKLFHGTLERGSAFLEVTKLTAQEAKKLVESTKEHHDLLPRLTELLTPYLSAAELAKLHHRNIVNSLEEQLKRFEAIAATPVYDKIAKLLKQLLDWIEENRSRLVDIVKLIGDSADHALKLAEQLYLGDKNAKGLLGTFSHLALTTELWVEHLMTAVALIGEIAKAPKQAIAGSDGQFDKRLGLFSGLSSSLLGTVFGKELPSTLGATGASDSTAAISKLLEQFSKSREAYQKRVGELNKLLNSQLAPKGFVGPLPEGFIRNSAQSVLDQGVVGKGDHPSIDKEPRRRFDARGSFEEEIALIRDYYEEYRDAIKDGEADLTISKREAADKIAELNEQEIEAIQIAGAQFRKALQDFYRLQIADNKATPGDLEDALSKFDASQINAERRIKDQTDQARRAAKAEGNKVDEIEVRNRLALLKEEANQELAIAREKQSQNFQTELQALTEKEAIEKRAHDAEIRAIDVEVNKLAEGTERRAQLLAQRALLEQRFMGVAAANALQRISLAEREEDATRKHQLALQESGFESEILQKEITESAKAVQSAYVDIFSVRDKDTAAKIREVQIELQLAEARGKTVESTRALREQLAGLTNQRLQNLQGQIQTIQGSSQSSVLKQIDTRAAIQNARSQVILQGPAEATDKARAEFTAQIELLDKMLAAATPSIENSLQALERKIFGMDFSELERRLREASDSTERFAIGLDVGLKALSNISSIVSGVQAGYQKGGVLGGAGAALKEASGGLSLLKGLGLFKGLSKSIPLVGEALGGVLEFIGPLFTKAAERIANEVKKSFQKTMSDFQAGYITLQQTLNTLEAQRRDAIVRLSGKKGGQDKLDELLPQFDQQIQSLQSQQRQIIDTFEQSLSGLELHSDALSQIQSQWTQIVKTVQQYLNAGGDATKASSYLSLQLEKMQEDAVRQLDDANQQAIQDAITLNDLLEQRSDLTKQFEREKFDLLNEDSIERRQAGAVSRGSKLKELEEQQKKQLDALDQQISLTTRKVEMEAKVFNLSMDIADLHRTDEELTLKALNDQIERWQSLRDIANGIYQMPDGLFSSNNPLFTRNISVIVNMNGDITGVTALDPRDIGRQIGDSVEEAIERSWRSGTSIEP